MDKSIVTPDNIRPPSKPKSKRKPRSDKGVKRGTAKTEVQSKVTKSTSKYLFDEMIINNQWYMQVKDNLVSRSLEDTYVIEFWLDGIHYVYTKYFSDPTMAYAVGSMYLDFRYKNKGMFKQ